VLFAANSLGLVVGVQVAARLAARFGPQWVLSVSTAVLVIAATRSSCDQLVGLWGTMVPLFVFMTRAASPCRACRCSRSIATARRQAPRHPSSGRRTSASRGHLADRRMGRADAGITASTMAAVMMAAPSPGLSLWLVVRPRTVARLAP
jgi:DHA1 family bicyclomycin/chloramphenicol resistance-like MFS transporter